MSIAGSSRPALARVVRLGIPALLLAAVAVLATRSCPPSPGVPEHVTGTVASSAAPSAAPLRGPYLGQAPPGETPQLFAPGIVSTEAAVELNGVVSPDGHELFFTRMTRGASLEPIFRMHRVRQGSNGGWSLPEVVLVYPGDDTSLAVDMAYSPDGRQLYFLGQHPHQWSPEAPGLDLWVSDRTPEGRWSPARPVPPPIWSPSAEGYPVLGADGTLQFSSDREGGLGKTDLWRAAPLPDGGFGEPVNLGAPVNSVFTEGDSAIGPDDRYVVFASSRPGGFGNVDLWASFHDLEDGTWSEPVNLGDAINTADTDFCPMFTPDGRYLFFSRRVSEPADSGWEGVVAGDVYWVDAHVVEGLQP